MGKDISSNVLNFWERGLVNKEQGNKVEAMKEFSAFYDILSIFKQCYNLGHSKKLLQKRLTEVKNEIRELLLDEDYLRITATPPERIADLKTKIELSS